MNLGGLFKKKSTEAAATGEQVVGGADNSLVAKGLKKVRTNQLNLLHYFLFTSSWLFVVMIIFVTSQESGQRDFMNGILDKQNAFVKDIQGQFAKVQDAEARKSLLAIHEAGNVNITRLFANSLWEKEFAPFSAAASQISVEHCREIADIPDPKDDKKKIAPPEKKACFSEVGKKIMALPRFKEINAKVYDLVNKSSVFKIKVFDLRGITVYSSEHAQIGEDKSFNAGWKSAMNGKPNSELTRRGKFSAFEGVVENRDLISSYMPMAQPGTDTIVGVFEIYSDVTGFVAQMAETSASIKAMATVNEAKLGQESETTRQEILDDMIKGQVIFVLLLIVLFLALFFIVRNAHLLIKRQQTDRSKAQQQLAQSEKMASLGQMVAGVAHQLNTPLAFTKSNVEMAISQIEMWEKPVELAVRLAEQVRGASGNRVSCKASRDELESIDTSVDDVKMTCEMLGDVLHGVEQMAELVHHMRTFTRLDRSKIGEVDLNDTLHSVVYISRSVIPNRIEVVEEYGDMQGQLCRCVPSQVNQVVLNLVNNASQAIEEGAGKIMVRSALEGDRFRVEVEDNGKGIPADVLPNIFETYYTTKKEGEGTGLGLSIAKEIVANHKGEITVKSQPGCTIFTFYLPVHLTDESLLA